MVCVLGGESRYHKLKIFILFHLFKYKYKFYIKLFTYKGTSGDLNLKLSPNEKFRKTRPKEFNSILMATSMVSFLKQNKKKQ